MEIKGWWGSCGYYGYVNGKYMLFANEGDYLDYVAELLADSREN